MTDAKRMQNWIKDTQMFQRIAGIKEASTEELERDWLTFNKKVKKFESDHAETYRIIVEKASKPRNN